MNRREGKKAEKMIKTLLSNFGKSYSQELGIEVGERKSAEVFKWFLASILFGARISETIAKNTYRTFEKYGLLTPKKILEAGLGFLIKPIMREGGYVRYDGVTSRKILGICQKLIEEYGGDINQIHKKAKNAKDLEEKLLEFKGIGPTTVNIFLRELRGIWEKADPSFSKFVKLAAKNLGIEEIKGYWQKEKVRGYSFVQFEAALLRLGKDFCYKDKCRDCPLKKYCQKGKRAKKRKK